MSGAAVRFDHVIVAVADLEVAAGRFYEKHGLASVPGGRHTGLGTGNRIIPLGDSYLELMAVVDEEEAATSYLAEWVRTVAGSGDRLGALCLRVDDIDVVASRIGEEPVPMQRERPDGEVLRWRLAGLQRTLVDPSLPFFIQWDVTPHLLPGMTRVTHRARPHGIAWVEIEGDPDVVAPYVQEPDLDIRIVPGGTGLRSLGIAADDGPIVVT